VGARIALLATFVASGCGSPCCWSRLAGPASAAPAMVGVDAAMVGLLAAAFHDPVLTGGIRGLVDWAIALADLR